MNSRASSLKWNPSGSTDEFLLESLRWTLLLNLENYVQDSKRESKYFDMTGSINNFHVWTNFFGKSSKYRSASQGG